jgi:hypothetical protein
MASFEVEHDFAAPRTAVAEVLCDPAFQTRLELPDLGRAEVVASSVEGTTRILRLRYEYVGQLDGVARRLLGDRKLTWIQELRLDIGTFAGTLTFAAEQDADRLGGSADVAITPLDDDHRSRRRIAGDLHVRVPVVGGPAERRIVPGLVRRLDVEASALSEELRSRD